MKKILNLVIALIFPIILYAQCGWMDQHVLDLANNTATPEFKAFFKNAPTSHYESYKVLFTNAKNSRKNIDELTIISENLDIIKVGEYKGYLKIKKNNPDLFDVIKTKFSDADERTEFIADLFSKEKIKIPPISSLGLISATKNLSKITETHLDAWKALKKYPNLRKGFSKLDGFSHVLTRFDNLDQNLKNEFLKALNTTEYRRASQTNKSGPSGAVSNSDLLINNIENFKNIDKGDDIIDNWLELRRYADDVNAQFSFKDIKALSNGTTDVESVVLSYGLRDYNLAELLGKFNYRQCEISARATGRVADNTFARLNQKLSDRAFGKKFKHIEEAYETMINGKLKSIGDYSSSKLFFQTLKSIGFNVFESHHVLVVELFKCKGFRKWYEQVGNAILDINGETSLLNVIMLEKFQSAKGVHASHAKYNEALIKVINSRWSVHIKQGEAYAIEEIGKDILKIRSGVKKLLVEKSVIGTGKGTPNWTRVKVNDLINENILRGML
ncbi:hypothetical protein [Aquimarina megaterium]|uniref:hypothetical protein n=1 Tax=Aquimarina megaterium TaxID=1443666 RepID=UPI00046E5697|nr:hypothetical protein [Aquimarina megaterium]